MAETRPARLRADRKPVTKALRICLALADSPTPLRLTELAARLDMLPSTAHRAIGELVEQGWLVRDEAGRYLFGPALLRIANATSLRYPSFARLAGPFLERLAGELQIMANAQLLERHGSRVVAAARSERYARIREHMGELVPAHKAAGGIVQVARLPEDEQQPYLQAAERETGAAGRRWFRQQLERAARDNLAVVEGKLESLFSSVGAAVLTRNGCCHGAVVGIALAHELQGRRLEELAAAIRRTAADIARVLEGPAGG